MGGGRKRRDCGSRPTWPRTRRRTGRRSRRRCRRRSRSRGRASAARWRESALPWDAAPRGAGSGRVAGAGRPPPGAGGASSRPRSRSRRGAVHEAARAPAGPASGALRPRRHARAEPDRAEPAAARRAARGASRGRRRPGLGEHGGRRIAAATAPAEDVPRVRPLPLRCAAAAGAGGQRVVVPARRTAGRPARPQGPLVARRLVRGDGDGRSASGGAVARRAPGGQDRREAAQLPRARRRAALGN